MRLVIDLLPYQDGSAPKALALAKDIVRAEPGTIVALSGLYTASVETLRADFAALIPRNQLVCGEDLLPASDWRRQAAPLVRKQFLQTLGEIVIVPGMDDTDAQSVIETHRARYVPPAALSVKPRLAYVSPLPPAHSGIADYSAELVAQLARYYTVELVVAQADVDTSAVPGAALRPLTWFEAHGGDFDRIVYHFGNSDFHRHMFGLIRKYSGVVVLHDFYLSGVIDNMERDGSAPRAFLQALYDSHGFPGLLEHKRNGRNPSIWKYPVNKEVLDNAAGVIVHSEFSRTLARQWYGPDAAADWAVVPLLRGRPATASRADARKSLGIKDDEFVICSFGMLGPIKLNEELLDAFLASKLATDRSAKLVFVGENHGGAYGAQVRAHIASSPAAERISITGFASAEDYSKWLAAADVAVQLRSQTRGETSAAILDCLLHGLPTIVNAHGSAAELPDGVLVKLPDDFAIAQLSGALEQLRDDSSLRASLRESALVHMAGHAPQRAGELVRDAIEAYSTTSPKARYRQLMAQLAALPGASDTDLIDTARSVAFNQPATAPRQLLVDCSAMVHTDLRTGIQRVVRSILLALMADPPPGFRIEPVFSLGANRPYQYARRFGLEMVGEDGLQMEDAPVDLRRGDVFLGLDLFTNGTNQNHDLLQSMRDRGVEIYFTVYDLLPVLRPEVFPFGTEQYFGEFLSTVTEVSDGIICISRAVADELNTWIVKANVKRKNPLQLGWFHLGADINASAPSTGLPANAQAVFDAVAARPTFIMVGTVEPRKGHAQTLAAFELLWEQGVDANLVVVGKQGWMMEALAERMNSHPERDKRLFWMAGVSDEMLLKLYANSSALLSPSEGEGFGLPLIEAAQHHIPIIARDIPVFREVAREYAYYFDGKEPEALARAINEWLELQRQGKAPSSEAMPWLTWKQSAQQVLDNILGHKWYKQAESQ
jgi:glycosyltransferase involved in cell wall biosynthesis